MRQVNRIFLLVLILCAILKSDIYKKYTTVSSNEIAVNQQQIDSTGVLPETDNNRFATPRVPMTLDISKLKGLDSTRIRWGIQLLGHRKVPEISPKTLKLLQKYNAYYVGDIQKKCVYFVFSASYEGGYTNKILDALKQNNVKAVFFLVGTYIKENPQLVKRIIEEGHEVGHHSMTHPSLPVVSDQKLQKELIDFDNYIYQNFGKQIKYFMPPSGEYSEKVLAAAKQMNYTSIFWSFAYLDYDENNQKGSDYAYRKVMSNLHNGAIIFLHTVSKDNANSLNRVLNDIKNEGFSIELLNL